MTIEYLIADLHGVSPAGTFLLCAEGALSEPILYLSLHFKSRRQEYYDHLQRVRTHGHWEGWVFRVHEYLQKKPITGIREMEKDLGLTYPTVAGSLDR